MILKSNDLICGYDQKPNKNPVLKSISFDIVEGSKVAILGANGSGKTTLLRAIAGILPYEGSLLLDDKEIRDYKRKEIARKLAIMTQVSQVYFSYTVAETVMLGRYLYTGNILGIPEKKDHEIVDMCLEKTGLSDLRDKQINELSGGQRQRVFLARTMAQQTPFLLLDEPTNHLDLKYQAELVSFINNWSTETTRLTDGREVKNTLIGVFHDINMAISVCDTFIILKDGQIIKNASKSEILSDTDALQTAYDINVKEYMQQNMRIWMT